VENKLNGIEKTVKTVLINIGKGQLQPGFLITSFLQVN
jgi:hypothetical protein